MVHVFGNCFRLFFVSEADLYDPAKFAVVNELLNEVHPERDASEKQQAVFEESLLVRLLRLVHFLRHQTMRVYWALSRNHSISVVNIRAVKIVF